MEAQGRFTNCSGVQELALMNSPIAESKQIDGYPTRTSYCPLPSAVCPTPENDEWWGGCGSRAPKGDQQECGAAGRRVTEYGGHRQRLLAKAARPS